MNLNAIIWTNNENISRAPQSFDMKAKFLHCGISVGFHTFLAATESIWECGSVLEVIFLQLLLLGFFIIIHLLKKIIWPLRKCFRYSYPFQIVFMPRSISDFHWMEIKILISCVILPDFKFLNFNLFHWNLPNIVFLCLFYQKQLCLDFFFVFNLIDIILPFAIPCHFLLKASGNGNEPVSL